MTPLALRTAGVELSPKLRKQIQGRLDRRLGKFAPHIERVTVRFEDQNGPRRGVDTVCRIKVVLSGLPSVIANEIASDAEVAFNRADDRVARAVKRAVARGQARGQVATGLRRAKPRPAERPAAATAREATSTASRNYKRRTRRATAALETSAQPRPSRKSTRKSVNRAKQGNKLARREKRRVTSPKRRAHKAQSRR
jgi:ribosome-associated translation inhibitor RaiA